MVLCNQGNKIISNAERKCKVVCRKTYEALLKGNPELWPLFKDISFLLTNHSPCCWIFVTSNSFSSKVWTFLWIETIIRKSKTGHTHMYLRMYVIIWVCSHVTGNAVKRKWIRTMTVCTSICANSLLVCQSVICLVGIRRDCSYFV